MLSSGCPTCNVCVLQELDEVIAQSKAQGKVLVLFCALTWCRPCKAVQRPSQKLAAAYKDCVSVLVQGWGACKGGVGRGAARRALSEQARALFAACRRRGSRSLETPTSR